MPRCRRGRSHVARARAIGAYDGPLRDDRPRVQVRRAPLAGAPARRAARAIAAPTSSTGADVVVPVPLHRARQRARGFNQAADCAAPAAADAATRCGATADTPSQTDLPAAQRHANVRGRVRARAAVRASAARSSCGGRCQHDRRDARGVRARAAASRGAGGARAYSRASRVATARDDVGRDRLARRSPSSRSQPACRGLAAVAVAHARQQPDRARSGRGPPAFAPHRGFGRDVEQDRQVGARQEPLDVGEPRRIEPLRFAVGDARGDVAVADDDDALRRASRIDLRPPLVRGWRRRAAASRPGRSRARRAAPCRSPTPMAVV